ncbi:MAG: hypothetical protein WC782_16230 [Methylococcaceae bacterium]|jgi:hypothetical protein
MLYVVEVPHEGRAKSWFAFDKEDFMRKVYATQADSNEVIFASTTAREQLERLAAATDSPALAAEQALLQSLAEQHGLDTVLYRADPLLGNAVYQTEAIDEFDACITAIAKGLKVCRIYGSETAAVNALYSDPIYDPVDEFYTHMALREQLIAMEVITDDL